MNKRQVKKKEKKELLLGGMTYQEDRKLMREMHEYEIAQSRNRKIPEDIEILVELGIATWEEVENKLSAKDKGKRRLRQLKKVNK